MELEEQASAFRGELCGEVASDESEEFEGGSLVCVGDVVEAVGLPGHSDEAAGGGADEIARG